MTAGIDLMRIVVLIVIAYSFLVVIFIVIVIAIYPILIHVCHTDLYLCSITFILVFFCPAFDHRHRHHHRALPSPASIWYDDPQCFSIKIYKGEMNARSGLCNHSHRQDFSVAKVSNALIVHTRGENS